MFICGGASIGSRVNAKVSNINFTDLFFQGPYWFFPSTPISFVEGLWLYHGNSETICSSIPFVLIFKSSLLKLICILARFFEGNPLQPI